MNRFYPCLLAAMLLLSGCGTLTGIPGHGGGKRFTEEQRLVASSIRLALDEMDVSPLRGKRVAIVFGLIADEGGGNIVGGRASITAVLTQGQVSTPTSNTRSSVDIFQVATSGTSSVTNVTTGSSTATETTNQTGTNGTTDTTTDNTGTSSSNTSQDATTNETTGQPIITGQTTEQSGSIRNVEGGVEYGGLGEYQNLAVPKSDAAFLMNEVRNKLLLSGVTVTVPEDPSLDAILYVSVPILGTNRQRTDLVLYNNEKLRAEAYIEMFAINRAGRVIMQRQTGNFETYYSEDYVLWSGPYETKRGARPGTGLIGAGQ